MKKLREPVLIILAILLFLFQIAVWIASTHPQDDANVLEVFWFMLKITVPMGLGCVCLRYSSDD